MAEMDTLAFVLKYFFLTINMVDGWVRGYISDTLFISSFSWINWWGTFCSLFKKWTSNPINCNSI